MAYVITGGCVADFACVEVCPVNCIAPLPDDDAFDTAEQLFINPATCISCGACRDICPVQAIFDADSLPQDQRHYAVINHAHFAAGQSGR